MRLPGGYHIDDPALPVLQATVSYWDVSTDAGAAAGTSLVCANLANEPSYQGQMAKILDGGAAGQVRPIISHVGNTIAWVNPCTDNTGAVQQIAAGTRFCIINIGGGGGADIIGMLARPRVSFIETWQDELGIDFTVWTPTNPATGAAWTRGAAGAYLRATSVPNANETARLRSNQRWMAAPGVYGANTILRWLTWEFEMRLTNLANLDNTLSLFGLTPNVGDNRASNNILSWALVGAGNALQSVTDLAGVETVNTGFGENLANWNKFRIEVLAGTVRFYLNEVLVATHVANLPDQPMYFNWFYDTTAGGAATAEIGIVRAWLYDIPLV